MININNYNSFKPHTPIRFGRHLSEESCPISEVENLILKIIEIKSPALKAHSIGVSMYSEALAKAAGCSEEEIDLATIGGLLHDTGKLGTPDEYFLGKFEPRLVAINNLHTINGEQILQNIHIFRDTVAKTARHHHENWNGNGYPDKLKGKDIDKISRIIAIADSIDAITRSRYPGQQTKSLENAVNRLREDNDGRWDPQLTKIFVRIFKTNDYELYRKVKEKASLGMN